MRRSWVIILLALLNLFLLCSNAFLTVALRTVSNQHTTLEKETGLLSRERVRLETLRARLEDRLSDLGSSAKAVRDLIDAVTSSAARTGENTSTAAVANQAAQDSAAFRTLL